MKEKLNKKFNIDWNTILIVVAGTYQKGQTKEKRQKKKQTMHHRNINMDLFNKMLWKS